jgi:transcription-repair coupling factor (superfamily II helicase)
MEETIKELKGEEVSPDFDPEVNLSIPAFIPDDYIEDVNQRLVVYKRLASCICDRGVEEIREELTDRYGNLPMAVSNLFSLIKFEHFVRQFLVSNIDYNGKEIILTLHPLAKGSLERILALIESDSKRFRFSPELKLSVAYKAGDWRDVMGEVKKLLQ